jgi:single-stranded-DNA-specific exonuclease
MTAQTFEEALEQIKIKGNYKNCIILFNPNWHLGIIGIVASKIMETFYKPVFMMTYSEETKQIRCSARSVEEVPVFDMMSNISEYFDGFGGHSMAGGFAFSTEKHTLEEVSEALSKTIDEYLGETKLSPSLKVDLELKPEEIDVHLVNEIAQLEPFGSANPSPTFVLNNVCLKQKKIRLTIPPNISCLIFLFGV